MTNAEKYLNVIFPIVRKNHFFGVTDDKVVRCNTVYCKHCRFFNGSSSYSTHCNIERLKWLCSEVSYE